MDLLALAESFVQTALFEVSTYTQIQMLHPWQSVRLEEFLEPPLLSRFVDLVAERISSFAGAQSPQSVASARSLLESRGIRALNAGDAVNVVYTVLRDTAGAGAEAAPEPAPRQAFPTPSPAPPAFHPVPPLPGVPLPPGSVLGAGIHRTPPPPPVTATPPETQSPRKPGARIDRVRSAPPPAHSPAPPAPPPEIIKPGGRHIDFDQPPPISAPPAPPPPLATTSNASVLRVFFATDRLQLPTLIGDPKFDKRRSLLGKLHLGACEISIPKTHHKGKLESPSILHLEFRPDPAKHIVLTRTSTLAEDLFFDQVRSAIGQSPQADAFVFVHGYNVSFEDAARRTGQIAYDLEFKGAPIFYSWPSNGRVADYLKDETNVAWSAPHLESFLTALSARTAAKRIHIIAHSMGNRAVCEALKSLSHDPACQLRLNHLVLAAPDIDADTFAELAGMLQRLSGRVTLYESSNDKAIHASKSLHGNPRAGEPLLIIPGVDTIDASAVDTNFLGHSYFSENWPLLADIRSILATDESAATRFGLLEMGDTAAGRYYTFRS